MMADSLPNGVRVLLAGVAPETEEALRAAGAEVTTCSAADGVAYALTDGPRAVVCAPGQLERMRQALDPLGLEEGPVVTGDGDWVVERVGGALRERGLRGRVAGLEAALMESAMQQARQLEETRLETLRRLRRIAEYRDDNSWEHAERVGHLAGRMGAPLGLKRHAIDLLRRAAPLHDIGKIAIPDEILLKPGKLDPYEFEVVKTHTIVGAQVLAAGDSSLVRTAATIARSHHERWDGGGYPDGLEGDAIPLVARIVQVADVFDILTHERPHKDAWSFEQAAEEIRRNAGSQFDPGAVAVFDELGADAWHPPEDLRDPTA